MITSLRLQEDCLSSSQEIVVPTVVATSSTGKELGKELCSPPSSVICDHKQLSLQREWLKCRFPSQASVDIRTSRWGEMQVHVCKKNPEVILTPSYV